MREILFKARAIEDGELVFGGLFIAKDKTAYIVQGHVAKAEVFNFCLICVDPETVCQFTGLTDKNGEMIFEGDKIEFNLYGVRCFGNVRIVDGNACVCIGNAAPFLDDVVKKCEAVKTGNIHDKEV